MRLSGFCNNYFHLSETVSASGDEKPRPSKARTGNCRESEDRNRAGTPALHDYSREASKVSSVADTFWARSSASALLSGRRYAILLP